MLDSSGVGALVSLYKRVRAYGGEVVMIGLRDQPLAIFRLLRLDRVMIGTERRWRRRRNRARTIRHGRWSDRRSGRRAMPPLSNAAPWFDEEPPLG